MSDTAEFQDSSKPSLEGETEGAGASPSATEPAAVSSEACAPAQTNSEGSKPRVYGPVPKPVAQPAIFDRPRKSGIHQPTALQTGIIANATEQSGTDSATTSWASSPSFSISAQRNASSSMNRQAPASQVSENPAGAQFLEKLGSQAPGQETTLHSSLEGGSTASWNSPNHTVDVEAGADETVTISVESQCDSPSLNEISEIDITDASREELMVYHSELMGWVRELEFALQDCQSDFKSHLQQYAQQEQLLEQRTDELLTLQERYSVLNQEIDTQQKAHQRQTILVETLQGQLDSSQERVAQMERDFSQIQRRCSDQAQQLLQAEGLCRDLKSRLSRQQRHTMQFKAALEKSLAVSVSDNDYDLGDIELDPMDSSGELFPRPKPVRPWSDQLDAAAVSQALSGLDEPSQSQPKFEKPTTSAAPSSKGASLQLAFEKPEDVDISADAARAKMTYGSASMGLVTPQAIANDQPTEPVFDPARAEDLETQLQQESESILQGNLLGSGATALRAEGSRPGSHIMVGGPHKVAFVPPIKPILPEKQTKQSRDVESAPASSSTEPLTEAGGETATASVSTMTVESDRTEARPKPTTLAGIDLPCFPKF